MAVRMRVAAALAGSLAAFSLVAWPPSATWADEAKPMATPMAVLAKAQVDGKYSELLRELRVDDEAALYGEFYNWGYYSGASYRGYTDLPAGYWVWVKPNWYIWGKSDKADEKAPLIGDPVPRLAIGLVAEEPRDEEPIAIDDEDLRSGDRVPAEGAPAADAPRVHDPFSAEPVLPDLEDIELFERKAGPVLLVEGGDPALGKTRWGPDQATGEPDTLVSGDQTTAWASSTPDGAEEWLELEYAEAFQPTKVLVHETYNPGAVVKLLAYTESGMESEIWTGVDPVVVENGMGVAEIPFAAVLKTKKIRIYLDSQAFAGWNEIDAVGLVDSEGKTHWAVKATASTTYGVADPAAGGAAAVFLGGGGGPAIIIDGDFGGPVPIEIAPADGPAEVIEVPGGAVVPELGIIMGKGDLILEGVAPPRLPADPRDARISELEMQVKRLQAQIDELKARMDSGDRQEPAPR